MEFIYSNSMLLVCVLVSLWRVDGVIHILLFIQNLMPTLWRYHFLLWSLVKNLYNLSACEVLADRHFLLFMHQNTRTEYLTVCGLE